MIRFEAKFRVYDGKRIRVPSLKKFDENFWCSFNTGKQLIMCSIVYLGDDINMIQNRWYNGIIELPYGEKFPPYGNEFIEPIILHQKYNLNCADEIIGDCILKSVKEIIDNQFNIRKDEFGNY